MMFGPKVQHPFLTRFPMKKFILLAPVLLALSISAAALAGEGDGPKPIDGAPNPNQSVPRPNQGAPILPFPLR